MPIPPYGAAPATIKSIRGLSQSLIAGGPVQVGQNGVWPNNSLSGTSQTVVTYQQLIYLPVACTNLQLVWFNSYNNDNVPPNAITITASIWHIHLLSIAGLTWFGQSSVNIAPGRGVTSDPISFLFAGGTTLFVRTCVTVTAGQQWPIGGYLGYLSHAGQGEGLINGSDQTGTLPGAFGGLSFASQYGVSAVLGAPLTPTPSIVFIGDSIMDGTGTIQKQNAYPRRPFIGGPIPFLSCPMAGELLSHTNGMGGWGAHRALLFRGASYCISNYGTNDLSTNTLAQMQANLLFLVASNTARNIKTFQLTLLPRATSTDLFLTVANQTKPAFEAIRVGFNDWLRDTSSAGFVAQAGGSNWAGIMDCGALIEVDATNTVTIDGGYWQAPITPVSTGTIVTVTNGAAVTLSQQYMQDQWHGYALVPTSGQAVGQFKQIATMSTAANSAVNLGATFSPVPVAGDAYAIYKILTLDGTHPTEIGHITLAAGMKTNVFPAR